MFGERSGTDKVKPYVDRRKSHEWLSSEWDANMSKENAEAKQIIV